jgi:hypothetical protein
MKKSVKKKPVKKVSREAKPDASQIALAVVEKAVGGKLGRIRANDNF